MNARRFPFRVQRVDDGVTITMNCGEGIYRARNVPTDFLAVLIESCRQARTKIIAPFRRKTHAIATLPSFPQCVEIGSGSLGPCDVRVTASRIAKAAEFCVAFYDAGDRTAPALLLIDEQIDEFIEKAEAVLVASDDATD
jgi:hypothetical protein